MRLEPHPPYARPTALEARHWGAIYALYRVRKLLRLRHRWSRLIILISFVMECHFTSYFPRVPRNIGTSSLRSTRAHRSIRNGCMMRTLLRLGRRLMSDKRNLLRKRRKLPSLRVVEDLRRHRKSLCIARRRRWPVASVTLSKNRSRRQVNMWLAFTDVKNTNMLRRLLRNTLRRRTSLQQS